MKYSLILLYEGHVSLLYVTLSLASKSFVFFLFRLEQDLIGLTSSGQVVYHSALVDVEDELTLSRKMLKRLHRRKMLMLQ